jgi:hypothetical protein
VDHEPKPNANGLIRQGDWRMFTFWIETVQNFG